MITDATITSEYIWLNLGKRLSSFDKCFWETNGASSRVRNVTLLVRKQTRECRPTWFFCLRGPGLQTYWSKSMTGQQFPAPRGESSK